MKMLKLYSLLQKCFLRRMPIGLIIVDLHNYSPSSRMSTRPIIAYYSRSTRRILAYYNRSTRLIIAYCIRSTRLILQTKNQGQQYSSTQLNLYCPERADVGRMVLPTGPWCNSAAAATARYFLTTKVKRKAYTVRLQYNVLYGTMTGFDHADDIPVRS